VAFSEYFLFTTATVHSSVFQEKNIKDWWSITSEQIMFSCKSAELILVKNYKMRKYGIRNITLNFLYSNLEM